MNELSSRAVKNQRPWTFLLCAMSFGLGGISATASRAAAASNPIVVLVQPVRDGEPRDAAAPVFVLYSDGRALVSGRAGDTSGYITRQLSADELSHFNGTLTDVLRDPDFDDRLVYSSGRTATVESFFYLGGAAGLGVATHVSGLGPLSDKSEARLLDPTTNNFPHSLRRLYRLMVEMDRKGATPWLPERVATGARPVFPGEATWRERIDELMRRSEAAPPRAAVTPAAIEVAAPPPAKLEPVPAQRKARKDLAPPLSLPAPKIEIEKPKP